MYRTGLSDSVCHPLRRAWTLTSVLGIALVLALPAAASASSPSDTLGVYAGAGRPDQVAQFENTLGHPVTYVHDSLSRVSWAELTNPTWWLDQWRPTPYRDRVIYSIPMLPNIEGVSLADGARGLYDGHFEELAKQFVAGGRGDAILRIGWEFNGTWFNWSIAGGNAQNYVTYWRRIVDKMRRVPGANFKFDWCVNADSSWDGGQQMEAEDAWPGAAYVDYIGADAYDHTWGDGYQDPAVRWNNTLTRKNGLNWLASFAAAQGKPITIPEWGIARRADGHGGGDSPYYIDRMADWISAHNVAYNMYWNFMEPDPPGPTPSNLDARIFTGETPQAAARFIARFGGGSD